MALVTYEVEECNSEKKGNPNSKNMASCVSYWPEWQGVWLKPGWHVQKASSWLKMRKKFLFSPGSTLKPFHYVFFLSLSYTTCIKSEISLKGSTAPTSFLPRVQLQGHSKAAGSECVFGVFSLNEFKHQLQNKLILWSAKGSRRNWISS